MTNKLLRLGLSCFLWGTLCFVFLVLMWCSVSVLYQKVAQCNKLHLFLEDALKFEENVISLQKTILFNYILLMKKLLILFLLSGLSFVVSSFVTPEGVGGKLQLAGAVTTCPAW